MLPNRESGPQNQPKANVAVSVLVGAAASIGGIGTVLPVLSIVFPSFALARRTPPTTSAIRQAPNIKALIVGPIMNLAAYAYSCRGGNL